MHSLDWVVIIVYFVVITAIGLIAGYRVRQSGEYFLGGRRFGPWLMIGQSFGVGTHACPGETLATAIASAAVSALLRARREPRIPLGGVTFRPSVNIRMARFA